MPEMRFTLNISAEEYQRYYAGWAKLVHVRAEDGRTLKFPASQLQQFVSHDGIKGKFQISFDEQYKLLALTRID